MRLFNLSGVPGFPHMHETLTFPVYLVSLTVSVEGIGFQIICVFVQHLNGYTVVGVCIWIILMFVNIL
jgi:hypothetical protein